MLYFISFQITFQHLCLDYCVIIIRCVHIFYAFILIELFCVHKFSSAREIVQDLGADGDGLGVAVGAGDCGALRVCLGSHSVDLAVFHLLWLKE